MKIIICIIIILSMSTNITSVDIEAGIMSLNSTCGGMYGDTCDGDACYQMACHYSKIPGTAYVIYTMLDSCDDASININRNIPFGSALVSALFVNCTESDLFECGCGKIYPAVKCSGYGSCRNAMCDIYRRYNGTFVNVNFEPLSC